MNSSLSATQLEYKLKHERLQCEEGRSLEPGCEVSPAPIISTQLLNFSVQPTLVPQFLFIWIGLLKLGQD